MAKKQKILEVNNLGVQFKINNKIHFNAVRKLSFDVYKGEVVGLVGESGSGKSSTAKAIMGMNPHSSGFIKIDGEYIPALPRDNKGRINKWLSSKVQMIFQDAKSSLNPKETVFDVVVEGAKAHKLHKKVNRALENRITSDFLKEHKKEFGKTKNYKYIEVEHEYKVKKQKIVEQFATEESKWFTLLEDLKIEKKSKKLGKQTRINTIKTHYHIYLANLRAQAKKIKGKKEREDFKDNFVQANLRLKKKIAEVAAKFDPMIFETKSQILKQSKISKQKLAENKKWYKKELNNLKDWLQKNLDKSARKSSSLKSNGLRVKLREELKNKVGKNPKEFYKKLVSRTLKEVSISPTYLNRYPGEFSGGQAQRIAIARTLMMNSNLIIADEPISALDVSIQAQVINILKDLIKKRNLTILFIAHDLQMVRYISDRIIVMYKGEAVEQGPADEIYNNPIHPYTQSLINAVPSIDDPSKIMKAKVYQPDHRINFVNFDLKEKTWHKVNNKGHMIFSSEENFKKWNKK